MAKENNYDEFNKFQNAFFTNTLEFEKYTNFEVKKLGYVLLSNIAKGYPHLSNIIINLNGFGWNGGESIEILKALQRKFINNFNSARMPKFIYWKQNKPEKSKEKVKKTKKGLDFSSDINTQIMSILMYDSKTFEYLKYSEKVQTLGNNILGELVQIEKTKALFNSQIMQS
jgi:hypothetical protein